MRILSIWLLVLGVCAGFQVRAFGVDPCDILAALRMHEHGNHDGHNHGHQHDAPCDSSNDEQCPLDHHHHSNCTHCMPMTAEIPHPGQTSGIHFSLVPIRSDSARAPDAPCADLDKPPLI